VLTLLIEHVIVVISRLRQNDCSASLKPYAHTFTPGARFAPADVPMLTLNLIVDARITSLSIHVLSLGGVIWNVTDDDEAELLL
jgi:hypothetical protein